MSRRLDPRRLPLRLKVAAAFLAAMAVLLAGLCLFVYGRFQHGLDSSIAQALRSRTADIRALVMQADTGLTEAANTLSGPTGGFAQVLRADGHVLDATPGMRGVVLLQPGDVARARTQPVSIPQRRISRLAGDSRLLASPVDAQGAHLIVVVGEPLQERAQALADLRAVMLVGGPIALLLASLLGYGASALSLRGVEAMRRQAGRLSIEDPDQRLPVPQARDEVSRLAETLNEMLARNAAAFQRERRFVTDASHELRTPLAVLRAEVDVALDGEASPAELRAALASVAEEADRLSQLAEDLLTTARKEGGKLPLEPADVRVSELFERVARRFSARGQRAGRPLVAGAPGDLVVRGDPVRLEQALSNLVDNSFRHGGGHVEMFAEHVRDTVELHVADEGPGFDADFIPLAFERFARQPSARARPGSGLGLSIVQSIAEAHGGLAVVANRRPGGGADTWISLPQQASPEQPPAAPLASAGAHRWGKRPSALSR